MLLSNIKKKTKIMKHIKLLPVSIALSFVYWLAFHENYTFAIYLSWFCIALSFIGLWTEQYRKDIKETSFLTVILELPFTAFNLWVFYNSTNGGYNYGICYVILTLVGFSIMLHAKSED